MTRFDYHTLPAALSRQLLILAALLLLTDTSPAQDQAAKYIAQTPPRTPAEQVKLFHLPEGFRIELVASEPEVVKPINLNFDAAGRLLVSQSVEYPFPAPSDRKGRDAIKLIADSDRNGVPDKVTTFADGLSIPIGVTPVADGVIGYSIPNLYHFPDLDGDGRADRRDVAFREFGFRDTHGMSSSLTWWIDGWVYGCHGFANTSIVQGADGQPVTMNSGNTYRFRQDGSHIEYFTHGQVNPFGLTFDPLGNVYTSDCHTRPIYMLVRGAYYPSFGKEHDGLGFGPEMMRHSHGSTGIAGVIYYAADFYPPKYLDTLFVANPVTGRVNHDRLKTSGSTHKAIEQPDFLSCDDPWFRPVDLQVGPDGAIYIADFYNRVIGHYEVPLDHPQRDRTRGRVWRVSYVGTDEKLKPRPPVPDLTQARVEELINVLGHRNLGLRTHATHQLVHRIGPPAVAAVRTMIADTPIAEQRAHGVWVLARLDALDERLASQLADDQDRLVRVHLVKALAERGVWNSGERELVIHTLGDQDPFVRRASADALGRHPHADNVSALLDLWKTTSREDELLVHTARIALRETIQELQNLDTLQRQLENTGDSLQRLAEVSLGIRTAQAAEFLLAYYERQTLSENQVGQTIRHIGRYANQNSRPKLDRLAAQFRDAHPNVQHDVLLALYRTAKEKGGDLNRDQRAWGGELSQTLILSQAEKRARRGIEFARELQLTAAAAALTKLASSDSPHGNLRAPAVDALVRIDADRVTATIRTILEDSQSPDLLRQQMAEATGRLNTSASRRMLVELFKVAPESLAVAVARSLAGSREGAPVLVKAAEKGIASPRLLQDAVVKERLNNAGVVDLSKRLAKLLAGLPPGDERLQKLIAARKTNFLKAKPDPVVGANLFKKNCSACHQINGQGNKVGPELDGVGIRGLDRLLEDVLDPNRNVDANFRASVILLSSGLFANGLVVREEGEVLIIIDDKGKERRVDIDDIDDRRESKLSPMPANVSELMNETEFQHLIAYLLDQRRKPQQAKK